MWNVEDDLLKIDSSKDVACNLSVLFSIRRDDTLQSLQGARKARGASFLDMTVFNRSNDLIWGALGANVVHFSFLQEYVAAHLGLEVGVYNQISNNLHVYTERWEPGKWLADETADYYLAAGRKLIPLVRDPAVFDEELPKFVEAFSGNKGSALHSNWKEPFFQYVASPMLWAFELHKKRQYETALNTMSFVTSDDWNTAGRNWIQKRKQSWEAKPSPII
jgi:hypothetical protein